MEIYETLVKVRDMVSREENDFAWAARAYTLGQIAEQALTNEKEPDVIPKELLIKGCNLNSNELYEVLQCLDLEPTRIVLTRGGTPGTWDYFITF